MCYFLFLLLYTFSRTIHTADTDVMLSTDHVSHKVDAVTALLPSAPTAVSPITVQVYRPTALQCW